MTPGLRRAILLTIGLAGGVAWLLTGPAPRARAMEPGWRWDDRGVA